MRRLIVVGGAVLVLMAAGIGLRPADAARVSGDPAQDVNVFTTLGPAGRLGVSVRDVEQSDVQKNGLPNLHGAVVTDVVADGPAAKAGVRKGDIVVEFDGEPVRTATQFSRLVRETPVGRGVKMSVLREDRQRHEVTVAPEASSAFNPDQLGRDLEENLRGLRSFRFFTPDDRPQIEIWPPLRRQPGPPPQVPRRPRPFGPPTADRGRMGVTIQELTPQLADYFGTKDGVLVSSVVDDSPAAKAGLKAGDIITALDGRPVTSADDLRSAIQRAPAGADVTLDVMRNHRSQKMKVKLSDEGKARIVPL